jgi:hypothetical protein
MLRFLLHIILLFPIFLNAQVTIVNRSLTDSTLPIAYVGVDNAIELMGYKSKDKLSFSTTNGVLTDLGQNRYVLRELKEGECILTFKEKEKLIVQKAFKVEIIPEPKPRFSNVNDTIVKGQTTYLKINLLKFLSDPTLRIYAPMCFLKNKGEIQSFRITYDGAGFDDEDEILVTGSRLSDKQVELIRKRFRNNTYMSVDEIRCLFPDGRTRKLTPLFYIVSN